MAEDCLLEAVRGLRLAHPELGPKPLLAKLREQHPDLGGGRTLLCELMSVCGAEPVPSNRRLVESKTCGVTLSIFWRNGAF